jgi:hypothetical protein
MAINDKFEPFSDEAIKARDKIVECMIVMAKIAYGAHNTRIPKISGTKNAVIYCLSVATYMDSNGDGIGAGSGISSARSTTRHTYRFAGN